MTHTNSQAAAAEAESQSTSPVNVTFFSWEGDRRPGRK